MHVPDGFINAPVSVAAGAVAVGAVAVSLRGARRELQERTAPLAGLVAAFIFAVQMLNFPVGAGTSGHLLGGALAAILVGPYTGVLCISVVLLMQAVLFADGGLTALGVNITTMGVVGVLVAYGVFRGLVKVLPRGRRSVTGASAVAAVVSVPAAAAAFVGLYALGGTADVALGKVLAAMVGVHIAIGAGEAVITMLTVGAVLAVRPDLVYGARGTAAPLTLRTGAAPAVPGAPAAAEQSLAARAETRAAPAAPAVAPAAAQASRRTGRVWLAGLAATLVCAGVVSYYASADPDGLEAVAAEFGFDDTATEHGTADSPLADYGVADVENARLSGGLAGVLGVGATLAVGSGVFVTVRRRRAASAGAADPAVSTAPHPAVATGHAARTAGEGGSAASGAAATAVAVADPADAAGEGPARGGTGASPRVAEPTGADAEAAEGAADRQSGAGAAPGASADSAASTATPGPDAPADRTGAPGAAGEAPVEAERARSGGAVVGEASAGSRAGAGDAEGRAGREPVAGEAGDASANRAEGA